MTDRKFGIKLRENELNRSLPKYLEDLSKILLFNIDRTHWHDPIKNPYSIENFLTNYRCKWTLLIKENNTKTIDKALNEILIHETAERECIYLGQKALKLGAIDLNLQQVISHWKELLEYDGDDFIFFTPSRNKYLKISFEDEFIKSTGHFQTVYNIYVYSNDWYLWIRDLLDPFTVD